MIYSIDKIKFVTDQYLNSRSPSGEDVYHYLSTNGDGKTLDELLSVFHNTTEDIIIESIGDIIGKEIKVIDGKYYLITTDDK